MLDLRKSPPASPEPLSTGLALGQAGRWVLFPLELLATVVVLYGGLHLIAMVTGREAVRDFLQSAAVGLGDASRGEVLLAMLALALLTAAMLVGIRALVDRAFRRRHRQQWSAWWLRRQDARLRGPLVDALDEGEEPEALLAADPPGHDASRHLFSATLAHAAQAWFGIVVAFAALLAAGSHWVDGYLMVACWGLPLLVWLVVLTGPPTLDVLLGLGLAVAALDLSLFFLGPDLARAALGHPLTLVTHLVALGILGFLIHRWRERRLVLLTSKGARELRVRGGVVLSAGEPAPLRALLRAPGPVASHWTLVREDAEDLLFHPAEDDPERFLELCERAGFSVKREGRGGVQGPLAEVSGRPERVVVPAVFLAMALWLVVPLVHLGFLLGKHVIVNIAPLTEGPPSAARGMIDGCRKIQEAYPGELISTTFRTQTHLGFGELEEAEEGMERLRRALHGGTFQDPDDFGQVSRLYRSILVPGMACARKLYPRPAAGWEPRDPEALWHFRQALVDVAGLHVGSFRIGWSDIGADLRRAVDLEPAASGPRVLAVLYALQDRESFEEVHDYFTAFEGQTPTEAELAEFRGRRGASAHLTEEGDRGGGRPSLEEGVELLVELLRPLEEVPAWRGLVGQLEGRLPPFVPGAVTPLEVAREFLLHGEIEPLRDRIRQQRASPRRPLPVFGSIHEGERGAGHPDCQDESELSPMQLLVLHPPESLGELLDRIWPELRRSGRGLDPELAALADAGPEEVRAYLVARPGLLERLRRTWRRQDWGDGEQAFRLLTERRAIPWPPQPGSEEGGRAR